MYDGNYLNYRAAAPAADIKRIDIVKTALSKVLTGYDDVNLGLMRFNNVDGGVVLQAVADISTSAAAIDTFLAGISGVANTPLSETAYEAALYWRGMPAHYGELIEESVTDPDALVSLVPEIYRAPPTVGGTCARNFNIILSDGLPKNDADTKLLAPTLPGFEVALGRTACDDYVNEGDCLDDITEYLSRYDINSTAPGDQLVKTYTDGFLADLTILKE